MGNRADSKFKKLVNVVHNQFIPNKLVILVDPKKNQSQLGALNPLLQNMTAIDEGPTAYVCVNFSCQKPTTDENELLQQLKDAQGLNK